jgi:hypothetical protein
VAAGCPPLFSICRARGLLVDPVLELLISNPLELRAPVAPALAERASRPLVGNCTLQRSDFSSAGLVPFEGFSYAVRSQAVLMPTVVAVVVRCGRAFSGDAAARVLGDVGRQTGRPSAALRLPRRNDRACACTWPFRSWWGPLVRDGCRRLQLMCVACAVRGAWLP